ncbi:AI-2E family transporter [Halarcobacter ebronensis]|uniref:AI-2E family transporter n=1 Tax=Halarcobacter ebronensis TaxID=1462615 RepID=A0A4Q0YFU1_9BACT|nr:AI-2E family transporter [Halarcobacter ebronensis]QKF80611.1 putative autoinducer 2 (AI-2E family) transporter [Halarcobacter ebronensis]RXJ68554.1 AI-2E family transporter [Halarcobacter ebronensis]RXK08412.1 AI-2E family transporter [Halarcobacter ebronensis]
MTDIHIRKYFFYLACIVVILAGLKAASEIVIILFLAIFISSIISTVISFLEGKNFPKIISYLVVLAIFTLISLILAYIVNISLKDFLSNLPQYEKQLQLLVVKAIAFAESYGVSVEKKTILDALNFSSFFGITTNLIGSIGTFLSKFLLIIIGIAFILAESKSFERKLKIIFEKDKESLRNLHLFSFNIKKYFLVKTSTSFFTGFFIAITLIFFGIDYPILWGVIAMLFNFVPVVGSIIAAIPAVLLSLVSADLNTTIILIVLYVFINITISNIVEPKFMGKELGLSPLVIFFSLILWGWILGIVGMFLAVPITMTLKIAFDSNHSTKWISLLMSNVKAK